MGFFPLRMDLLKVLELPRKHSWRCLQPVFQNREWYPSDGIGHGIRNGHAHLRPQALEPSGLHLMEVLWIHCHFQAPLCSFLKNTKTGIQAGTYTMARHTVPCQLSLPSKGVLRKGKQHCSVYLMELHSTILTAILFTEIQPTQTQQWKWMQQIKRRFFN